MKEPTDKQIKFATIISEVLEIDLPEDYTSFAYWEFINKHKTEYDEIMSARRDNRMPDWYAYAVDEGYFC